MRKRNKFRIKPLSADPAACGVISYKGEELEAMKAAAVPIDRIRKGLSLQWPEQAHCNFPYKGPAFREDTINSRG